MYGEELPDGTVMLDAFASALGLEPVYAGRGYLKLSSVGVDRPGLRLAGYFAHSDPRRIIVIGLTEQEYLRSLKQEERAARIAGLFENEQMPCIVFARSLPVPPEFLAGAERARCPVLRTPQATTSFMSDLFLYLNRLLAPTAVVHGVLMDVSGVGILLTGKSGVGKSETAMELIKRGHRLVADDSVIIRRMENKLVGTSPDRIRYFMELRGIGIINVRNMYGSGAVLGEKEIELVMELEPWQAGKAYDRLGDESAAEVIMGQAVPKLVVPVSPGRNLAILIEVAARNHRLKGMGYDAAQELIRRTIGR